MALSNIFEEPRREIIETTLGLAVVGSLSYAGYSVSVLEQGLTGGEVPWQIGMLIIFCLSSIRNSDVGFCRYCHSHRR